MRRNRIMRVFASAWLIISMMLGIPFNSMVQTVKADTTAATSVVATNLPMDTSITTTMKALGLPIDQPSRTDAAGNIIDKNASNPLGSKNLVLNKTLQLATAGVGNNANDLYDIYNKPLGAGEVSYSSPILGNDKLLGKPADLPGDWRRAPKAMTSADITGTGKDVLITAALPSVNADSVKLELIVTDYNGGNSIEKENVLVSSMAKPVGYNDIILYPIHVAAGDFDHDGIDEIAIVVGRTLYICKVTESSTGVIFTNIKSSTTFDESNPIANIPDNDIPRIDVKAGDADGDGFKELIVTTGSTNGGAIYTPKLLIYHSTDATKPAANIELKYSNSSIYKSASIAVGDVFGEEKNVIAIGGDMRNAGWQFTTIYYHPVTQTYDTTLSNKFYTLSIPKVLGDLKTLNCVSLETPVPGQGQYVVFGDVIFKYDSKANNGKGDFVRRNVSNTIYGGGNISNVNYSGGDTTYIVNTIVGNFDGNTSGKEQIIMIHYNNWWSGPAWEYVTWCSMDSKGNIYTHLNAPIWHGGQYNFPAICATDVYDSGVRLQYDHSEFTFSDPRIVAVLGAAPYYKELAYGDNLKNSVTNSGGDDNGFITTAGMSFGYNNNSSIYGTKVNSSDIETLIKQKITNSWKSSISVSKNFGISSNNNDDMVVVSTIPYDIYYYNVYNSGNKSESISMNIPYAPVIKIMSLVDYNQAVSVNKLTNVATVSADVLKHTAGNPRTYPGDNINLSNATGKKTIKGSKFIDMGSDNSLWRQSIAAGSLSDPSFDTSFMENVSFKASAGGIYVGMDGKSGYNSTVTTSILPSTVFNGSVPNLPQGNENYKFSWNLAAYNYDLPVGNSTQRCTVLAYLVNPIAGTPPAVPDNFRVVSSSASSATFEWDKVTNATGYKISRSLSKDGPYTKVGELTGVDSTNFMDTDLIKNTTYYYTVLAKAASYGKPSDPLTVQTVLVNSISIDTEPKLFYSKGNLLDLSSLVVTLNMKDGTRQKIGFADFAANSLTVSLAEGSILTTSDSGTSITITHTPSGQSVQTKNLTVNVDNSNNFAVSAVFKVGAVDNATELLPNTLLSVNARAKNNQSSSQEVILVIALYDNRGNIVNISYLPENIEAGADESINGCFRLPSNVTNYSAKVFVWDGLDISLSSRTFQSNVIEI